MQETYPLLIYTYCVNVRFNCLQNFNIFKSPSLMFALILFSFNFKLSNTSRWLILLVCSLLYIRLKNLTSIWMHKKLILFFAISLLLSYLPFRNNSQRALQFLSFGYDNAFQFSAFRGFSQTSWYPNIDFANWFTDFQLFKSVPMGHSALMSFILHPFTFIDEKTETQIVFYATFQIFSIFLLIFLVHRFLNHSLTKDFPTILLRSIFSFLIVTCVASTMLVNGFAPYYWCLVLILFWINFESKNDNRWRRNFALSLCIYSVSIITPAPVTLLFFPAIMFVLQEIRVKSITTEIGLITRNIFPFILIGALVLFSFRSSSAGLGWRQLLHPGGLQNINLGTTIAILTITFSCLIQNRHQVLNDPLALIVISSVASSGALSALTLLNTGNIQYYAIKQIYLALFFSSIYIAKSLNFPHIRIFKSGLAISLLIYPIIFPTFYTAGYMGVLPNVVSNTFSKADWETSPVNAELILQTNELPEYMGSECYIWRAEDPFTDKDLSSRWLNAVKSKNIISENCFSAYWNNGPLSDQEFLERLANIDSKFVIFTDAAFDPEVNQDIEYVKIPKRR
jgi:hypothetical protein